LLVREPDYSDAAFARELLVADAILLGVVAKAVDLNDDVLARQEKIDDGYEFG
jgi:hypothetical protein